MQHGRDNIAKSDAIVSQKSPYTKVKSLVRDLFEAPLRAEPLFPLPYQKWVYDNYQSFRIQVIVAVSIGLNFIVSSIEKQINPVDGTNQVSKDLFLSFEIIFNIVFTIDLVCNLYGSWFMFFWMGPLGYWNSFDFVIVVSSWISLVFDAVPGLGVLRLLRAFRVFRLFKYLESLKLIIEGVLEAIPGVSNAFAILFIFMGIWSIIAVEYFREAAPEFFGNFLKAMFSMFQILTGDSWNAQITYKLVHTENIWYAGFFSVSFVFIAAIVLSNVVVAILLDKFLAAVEKQEKAKQMKRLRREAAIEEEKNKLWEKENAKRGGVTKEEIEALYAEEQRVAKAASLTAKVGSFRHMVTDPILRGFGMVFPSELKDSKKVQEFYDSDRVQITIGALIMCNFFVGAINAFVLPEDNTTGYWIFQSIDYFFTTAFTVELVINYYGNYPTEFWMGPSGGWNAFDFFIVTTSLLSIAFPTLPAVSVFRLFRAFRVIRLFKRVESLKLIVESVLLCMPKVFQTFTILLIITGVWSILGVEFFRHDSPEAFGTFAKSFLTMWQVLTCDSWASGDKMARYLIYERNMPLAALFFITYIFIATIIMSNVVITVLLEGYLKCSDELNKKKELEARMEKAAEMRAAREEGEEMQELGDVESGTVAEEQANGTADNEFDLGVCVAALGDPDVKRLMTEKQLQAIIDAITGDATSKSAVETIFLKHSGKAPARSSLLARLYPS